jgi:serine/threonine-protein kinase
MDATTAPGATPATGSTAGGLPTRLPPKLLDDAAGRLGWLSLTAAITLVLVQVFQHVAQPELALVLSNQINRLASLTAVLLALGVFALQRYRIVTASTILALGMVLEVAIAFCISIIETTKPFPPNTPVLGISALGPWIVAVGAFIPNRPIWTLVTAVAAATTWPVSYAINSSRFGFDPVPWGQLAVWPFFNYLMALLAYLIGRRTYGMTIAAQTAVELGSYRLVAPIAEGGMGQVWKASHQMLARSAAIKLVRPQAGSARQADLSVKRFKREANVIAGLQSPNTVYLYDFGVSRDGRFYYVMELLDGVSLQTLVATFGPQPASRVLGILRQICRSLEEAHRQGLVHRDLKPSNVMLCKFALMYDFVKVLDFGLAKFVTGDGVTVSQLTMEGMATGTPGYIAPEIAMGEGAVDGRADIYALGCVAYFLLTGTLVFDDPNPMSMALKHVQATPAAPSTCTELPIPVELDRIVLHCLEKKPGDRPSICDVVSLLDACGFPEWTPADAAEWWHQHLPSTSSLRSISDPAPRPALVVERG